VFRIRLDPPERPTLALPDRPSLAVLPFQNMSGDPEQEYFSDGIVEDITTALSRIGGLFVIARNSSFTYKGRAVDVKQVGRELGVRYVLEGSVRKAGGRIRITCQLIDAATGAHIWADRFDSTLDDVFELQDRVTESVTGAIEPSLRRAEIMRAAALPTKSLDAYDLYLHSLANYYTQTKASFDAAAEMLRRAIEIDPKYALAKAFLALIAAHRTVRNWTEPGDQETAIAMAREAIAGGQNDPTVLRAAGHALGRFREYDAALTAVSRAVRLNPNSAEVLGSAAWVHCYACEPEPAIEYLNRAIRLSPLDPEMLMFLAGLGLAYLIAGRATEAHATLLRAVKEGSSWGAWRFLVMAMVELGEIEDAKREALRYLAFNPTFRISTFVVPWRDRTFCERFVAALRKAGLPE
jgi:adenylate cyclase